MPKILLEDDTAFLASVQGLGQKFVLGPTAPAAHPQAAPSQELPESYGTGKFVLTSRDPHWLYAHWDLTRKEQRQHNARSIHRHLVVRVHAEAIAPEPVAEVHVHPESQHWFIHAEHAATAYTAELGYYRSHRKWVTIAQSPVAVTPPEAVAEDKTVRFATIDPNVPFSQSAREAEKPAAAGSTDWNPTQERALAEVFSAITPGLEQTGSGEIPGLIGGRLEEGLGGQELPELGISEIPQDLGGISSQRGGQGEVGAQPGFWLNLNAELIIYGGTQPGASVTLDGQPIQLRPDGTFSCRFALPDGRYEIIIGAMSEHGDVRQARLTFTRRTERQGEVGVQPSEEGLGEMPKNDE